MTIKISKKIAGYSVVDSSKAAPVAAGPVAAIAAVPTAEVIQMHERIERPEVLIGSTYKLKSPASDHAMYITINDIVLNPGTEHELRRPFEIFINSKSMDHFQWIVALTRIMSAVFRKGGDVTFVVDEMKAVFDPRGGYFKPGGVYMPSLVAELGSIVEDHLKSIGLLHAPELTAQQKQLLAEKRRYFEDKEKVESVVPDLFPELQVAKAPRAEDVEVTGDGGASFPPSATMCGKCHAKAVVIMDGCATCLNCGNSKCG